MHFSSYSLCSRGDLRLAMSETQKVGYVASGPILSKLARGPIVDQNCTLAGIVILLNQKVYFVNVYAHMSLNRLFSDSINKLMWDTKKSENILMRVRCPSTPPWTCPQYQYVLRSDAEDTTFCFKNEHKN